MGRYVIDFVEFTNTEFFVNLLKIKKGIAHRTMYDNLYKLFSNQIPMLGNSNCNKIGSCGVGHTQINFSFCVVVVCW